MGRSGSEEKLNMEDMDWTYDEPYTHSPQDQLKFARQELKLVKGDLRVEERAWNRRRKDLEQAIQRQEREVVKLEAKLNKGGK